MAEQNSAFTLNRCIERAGTWLVRQKVLYLLSAFLMLLGCYLISLPCLLSGRSEMTEPLVLLGVMNIYEGLVILACGYILRRVPSSHEAALLLIIEFLFLFDMTCTANACLSHNFKLGLLLAAGCFVLALVKLIALEVGAHQTLFQGMKRFLIAALVLLYSLQGMLVLYSPEAATARAKSAYAMWLLLGVLALLLPPTRNFPGGGQRLSQSVSFRRIIGAVVFTLLALQLAAQSWVHRADFEFSFIVPALCALIGAMPFFLSRVQARRWAGPRAGLLILLCASGVIAGSDQPWTVGEGRNALSVIPVRLDIFFGAAVAGLMLWRERSMYAAHVLCLLLMTGIIGTDSAALRQFCLGPSLFQFIGALLIGALWIATRPTFGRIAAIFLAELWLLLCCLDVSAAPWEFLRWGMLGLMMLCVLFNFRPQYGGFALQAAVFVCGVMSCHPSDGAALAYFYAVTSAWNIFAAQDWHNYGPVLLAYLVIAEFKFIPHEVPDVTIRWGWLVIVLAFASLGAAFRLTRQTLENKCEEGCSKSSVAL